MFYTYTYTSDPYTLTWGVNKFHYCIDSEGECKS